MTVDVEVVIGVLGDPAQRLELGKDTGRRTELVEQAEPAQGIGPGEQQSELGELALACGLGGTRCGLERQANCLGVELELELGCEPRGAKQPQGVGLETALGDDPQPPLLEVGGSPMRVARRRSRVRERDRDRVDGEVPLGQVGLDRVAAHPGHVEVPAPIARQHPPGPELGRERERGPGCRPGDSPGGGRLVAGDRDVDTPHDAAGERIAHRAADDPGLVVVGEGLAGDPERFRGAQPVGGAHPDRTYCRGTRDETAQTIS